MKYWTLFSKPQRQQVIPKELGTGSAVRWQWGSSSLAKIRLNLCSTVHWVRKGRSDGNGKRDNFNVGGTGAFRGGELGSSTGAERCPKCWNLAGADKTGCALGAVQRAGCASSEEGARDASAVPCPRLLKRGSDTSSCPRDYCIHCKKNLKACVQSRLCNLYCAEVFICSMTYLCGYFNIICIFSIRRKNNTGS